MRHALRWCATLPALVRAQEPPCGLATNGACARPRTDAPSFVVAVADDMGHGDAGYLGGRFPTPALDRLARDAVRLDAFYAASPVCSPTRASLLTGRHAARAGVHDANQGHLPEGEYSLPRALRGLGYATGHFGKWHVGVLSADDKHGSGRSEVAADVAPPWDRNFSTCFSTEAKMPTYEPGRMPRAARNQRFWSAADVAADWKPWGAHYWNATDDRVHGAVDPRGDDSKVVADAALAFLGAHARALAVAAFHAPHLPVVAPPGQPGGGAFDRAYGGALAGLDAAVGRLADHARATKKLFLFFSDNGPENGTPGSAAPFRGRKRSLLEGGVRVPALLAYDGLRGALALRLSSSDVLPTFVELATGVALRGLEERPFDGESFADALDALRRRAAPRRARRRPLGFEYRDQKAWLDGDEKLVVANGADPLDAGRRVAERVALYDLRADPGEARDLAAARPERAKALRAALDAWLAAVRASEKGGDGAVGDVPRGAADDAPPSAARRGDANASTVAPPPPAGDDAIVAKRAFSNKARFVFVAGLGGSGHHAFKEVFGASRACRAVDAETDRLLRALWYEDAGADATFAKFVAALARAARTPGLHCLNLLRGTMLGYPDNNDKTHHPDLVTLAAACERAGADLRVVVLSRAPEPIVASTAVRRKYLGVAEEVTQMSNQLAFLSTQLEAVDAAFFVCVAYAPDASRVAGPVAAHLAGGLPQTERHLAAAIARHYVVKRPDDRAAELATIRAHVASDARLRGFQQLYRRFTKSQASPCAARWAAPPPDDALSAAPPGASSTSSGAGTGGIDSSSVSAGPAPPPRAAPKRGWRPWRPT